MSTGKAPEATQPVSQPTSQSKTDFGWKIPSYDDLNKLAHEKVWPAVNAFVEKYQEDPSRVLLITVLSLLVFISLSAIGAILFLVATLAATLLMLALQITLVCSSVFIAASLSILSISTLATPGLSRLTEGSTYAKSLIARLFQSSKPSDEVCSTSSTARGASSAPPEDETVPQRGFVTHWLITQLLRPRVILSVIMTATLSAPIIFLLRRVIKPLLVRSLIICWIIITRLPRNPLVLLGVAGYLGYRIGSPSRHGEVQISTVPQQPTPASTQPARASQQEETSTSTRHLVVKIISMVRSTIKSLALGLKALKTMLDTVMAAFDELLVDYGRRSQYRRGEQASRSADIVMKKREANGEEYKVRSTQAADIRKRDGGEDEMLSNLKVSSSATSALESHAGNLTGRKGKGASVSFENEE